jgi:hypothetical protein
MVAGIDAVEQRARFAADQAKKQALYGETYPIDEDRAALDHGLSACAGIALGRLGVEGLTCKVETGRALIEAACIRLSSLYPSARKPSADRASGRHRAGSAADLARPRDLLGEPFRELHRRMRAMAPRAAHTAP